ncbi:tyrosine-type recombinase/integrase [Rhodospirillum sp. A1_3_36]|uniref:tyrosine-type recombinase/integrase n=1 Tax=Rhodospirillum sp. A1_3_36 TaxID=3391666 RepID=UPI0039A438CE
MANYRKNSSSRDGSKKTTFTATIRIPSGYPHPVEKQSFSQTFSTKEQARLWARRQEDQIKSGTWLDPRILEKSRTEQEHLEATKLQIKTLSEALDIYEQTVSWKKGIDRDRSKIKKWKESFLKDHRLDEITVAHIAQYRQENLTKIKPSTMRNDLSILSGVFELAITEWLYDIENPVTQFRKRKNALPPLPPGRDRRLRTGEFEKILQALEQVPRANEMKALFLLALETGMRQGELRTLKRSWIDGDTISIPDSKTNKPRRVILSTKALAALNELPIYILGNLFHSSRYDINNSWQRAMKLAGIEDFHFHDLRHEALSRMAAAHMPPAFMMRQSGHKTLAMLARYVNPTDDDIRQALRKMEAEN